MSAKASHHRMRNSWIALRKGESLIGVVEPFTIDTEGFTPLQKMAVAGKRVFSDLVLGAPGLSLVDTEERVDKIIEMGTKAERVALGLIVGVNAYDWGLGYVALGWVAAQLAIEYPLVAYGADHLIYYTVLRHGIGLALGVLREGVWEYLGSSSISGEVAEQGMAVE